MYLELNTSYKDSMSNKTSTILCIIATTLMLLGALVPAKILPETVLYFTVIPGVIIFALRALIPIKYK